MGYVFLDLADDATGIETSNPLQLVSKPFEIKVTCP